MAQGPDTTPSYPIQPGFSENPQWTNIHLYVIGGWFSNWFEDPRGDSEFLEQATAFSGRFRLDAHNHRLVGGLDDMSWGQSVIEGEISSNSLVFDQYYVGPSYRPAIEYELTKTESGLWKGTYTARDLGRYNHGTTECGLALVNANAYGIADGVSGGNTYGRELWEAKRRLK